jgi:hypothetical protein
VLLLRPRLQLVLLLLRLRLQPVLLLLRPRPQLPPLLPLYLLTSPSTTSTAGPS